MSVVGDAGAAEWAFYVQEGARQRGASIFTRIPQDCVDSPVAARDEAAGVAKVIKLSTNGLQSSSYT